MALSQWDQQFLPEAQQQEILNLTSQWATADDATRKSLNARAELIRQQYGGYTGGADGTQYNPIGLPFPQAPTIPTFSSEYSGMGRDMLEDIMNIPEWQGSEYSDLLQQQMSKYASRQFEYNPDTDPAYQAFKQRALAAGDKAYADNLGGLSAMTGGRPNTWAATVASQARNQYVLESEMAVTQFEDRAYQRYRDEGQDMLNFIGILDSLDTKAYNQYRDNIQDKTKLFDMVMTLEDRDFEKYKFTVDQTWKQFDTEVMRFESALEQKRQQISDALDRTNLLGYVDNEASALLGVAAGTLSQGARERAERMIDYAEQQRMEIENYAKKKAIDYQYDLKLISARGSSGSGGGSYQIGDMTYTPTTREVSAINSEVESFTKLFNSEEFNAKNFQGKREMALKYIDDMLFKAENQRLYGDNSEMVVTMILDQLERIPGFEEYVVAPFPKYYDRDATPVGMEAK